MAAAKSAAKQDLTDDIAAIQDDVDETQRIVDRLSDIAAKNPGDSEIGAALTKAQNQLDKAESALADAKDQLATVDDAKTLAQVDEKTAAGDADVAAAEAARQAADTDLQNAGAKSADNLNNAIADANKQADANLAAIQEDIEQIKDDIAALSKIAADNPNSTKIADLLADANKQLTEAQGRYKDAQADKDALAQATTLAEVLICLMTLLIRQRLPMLIVSKLTKIWRMLRRRQRTTWRVLRKRPRMQSNNNWTVLMMKSSKFRRILMS